MHENPGDLSDLQPAEVQLQEHGPPRPAFSWHRSLRFRLATGLVVLFLSLVIVSLSVIWWQGLPLLLQENRLLNQQIGENLAASLSQQFKQAETLSRNLAQLAEVMPYDDATYRHILPHLLDLPELKNLIAGGGLWPEPRQFDPVLERNSLFWGRDRSGALQFFDNYNDPAGSGYHQEEWYVPARLQPRDRAYWSRSYTDPYSLQPMVTCTTRFSRQGQFAGVATVDLKLEGVNALLQEKFRDRPGYAFVVDRNNKFIAFPDLNLVHTERTSDKGTITDFSFASELALIKPVFQPVAEQLALLNERDSSQADQDSDAVQQLAQAIDDGSYQIERQEAGVIAHNLSGPASDKPLPLAQFSLDDDILLRQPADVVIHQMPHTFWKIVSVFPRSETTRSAMAISRSLTWGTLGGITLAGLLFALFLWRVLLQRLDYMTHQIRDAAQQDPSLSLQRATLVHHHSEDELDLLGHWYNQRTRQLHEALLASRAGTQQLARENADHRATASLLEKTLALQHALLDSTNLIILSLDSGGMIQHCNAGTLKLLGYGEAELIGKIFPHKLILPVHLLMRQRELQQRLGQQVEGFTLFTIATESRRWTFNRKDGSPLQVLLQISPVLDSNGRAHGWVAVGTDLSGQPEATPVTPVPVRMPADDNTSLSFLGGLSQELRTALTSILGFSRQLQKKIGGTDNLDSIDRNANQLLGIANSLLDLSRIDGGQPDLNLSEFNLGELVDEVHTELRPLLEGKPIDYGYHIPKEPILMEADRRMIRQILHNLLSCAIRSTDHGSVDLTLSHGDTGGHVHLIFSDTGRGFSPEMSQRLFQPHTPLEGYTQHKPGNGLDLYLTWKLVQLHQGHIQLDSTPGKGTHITVDLPLRPTPA